MAPQTDLRRGMRSRSVLSLSRRYDGVSRRASSASSAG